MEKHEEKENLHTLLPGAVEKVLGEAEELLGEITHNQGLVYEGELREVIGENEVEMEEEAEKAKDA